MNHINYLGEKVPYMNRETQITLTPVTDNFEQLGQLSFLFHVVCSGNWHLPVALTKSNVDNWTTVEKAYHFKEVILPQTCIKWLITRLWAPSLLCKEICYHRLVKGKCSQYSGQVACQLWQTEISWFDTMEVIDREENNRQFCFHGIS